MRFFLAILLFCIVFIAGCGETNGCQPDWSNDCESNSNCCSGYCDNNDSIQWKTGVCKKDQEGSGDGKTKGASNLINWQPGDWAMDCDFFGNDMSSCQVPSERCTETCRETVGCTHFTWTDYKEGTCWMKKGSINKSEAEFKSGAVCGTVNTTTTTTTSTSMTTTTIAITKSCKPDFSTDCESNSDCCSGYCDHNHVEWHKGVCKNNTESSLTDLRLRGGVGRALPFTLTLQEFTDSLKAVKSPICDSQQDVLQKYTSLLTYAQVYGNIKTKRELAMFLSQILWESAGFTVKEEINKGSYISNLDHPNQQYYGRGYIQLTWAANYKEASYSLYKDDRLLRDPGLVSRNEQIAWLTSFWFWKRRVQPKPAVRIRGEFGASTKIINGRLECGEGRKEHIARKRFEIYKRVLVAFRIGEEANERGCYKLND